MWQRRLAGRVVSSSPHPSITSTPERASNGDVLSAGEGDRVRDVKRHSGGRVPIPADVVSRMRQLRGSGMSLRKVATVVAAEFRRPVMPAMSIKRIVERVARRAA
jgi:hypothetical protein